jgi:hypothetical protein
MIVNGQEATYCPLCSGPGGSYAVYVPNDEKAAHEAFHATQHREEETLA